MIIFWGGTQLRKEHSHVMVMLKFEFKIDKGWKVNNIPLVCFVDSVIEFGKWVGRYLEILVKEDDTL